MKEWEKFEVEIANYFRNKGAEVKRNVPIAGSQIDLIIEERTPSNQSIKTAVECKNYSKPVGVDIVSQFAALANQLERTDFIDKAILVSRSGFTTAARSAAESFRIKLIEYDEIKNDAPSMKSEAASLLNAGAKQHRGNKSDTVRPKTAFVAMPFSKEFYDLYVLGIAEACSKTGFTTVRVDEIEYGGSIVGQIQESIKSCSLVIADITYKNPNVFYEVGYAHALGKETIFICKNGEALPFDIASFRCIFYESIVEARQRLISFLQTRQG